MMYKKCIICGSNAGKMSDCLYKCQDCGHLEDITDIDTSIYNDGYLEKYKEWEDNGQLKIKDSTKWMLINKHMPGIKTVLDIGTNFGYFLDHVPPECNIKTYGYDKYLGPYQDESVFDREYDLITFFHTLEHIEDPYAFIKKLKCKYIMFTIPWLGDRMSARSFLVFSGEIKHGEHKNFYTRKSLNILLRDFKVLCEDYSDGFTEDKRNIEHIVTQIRERI